MLGFELLITGRQKPLQSLKYAYPALPKASVAIVSIALASMCLAWLH